MCVCVCAAGSDDDTGKEEEEEEESVSEDGEEEGEEEEEGDGGMEMLVMDGKTVTTEEGFSGVAAAAEQFQPKGTTLATAEVCCVN